MWIESYRPHPSKIGPQVCLPFLRRQALEALASWSWHHEAFEALTSFCPWCTYFCFAQSHTSRYFSSSIPEVSASSQREFARQISPSFTHQLLNLQLLSLREYDLRHVCGIRSVGAPCRNIPPWSFGSKTRCQFSKTYGGSIKSLFGSRTSFACYLPPISYLNGWAPPI